MKRALVILTFLMAVIGLSAKVYGLKKVNTIVHQARYVLVRDNKALTTDINASGELLADTLCKTFDLMGNEKHVWTINKSGNYYVLTNGSQRILRELSGSNKLKWSLGNEAGERWTVTFQQSDSSMSFMTAVNYYLAPEATNWRYKIRNLGERRFSLFRLIPMTYDRSATIGQLSTVCLPYAVDSVTGADVYQISWLEKDNQGQPYKLFFEEVNDELTAGRPYLFVPTASLVTFQKKDTLVVAEPQYFDDGFYGTFGGLIDAEASTPGNVLEGNYVVYNNTLQMCGGSCRLDANHAYINMSEVPTTQPSQVTTHRMLAISRTGVEYFDPAGIIDIESNTNMDQPTKLMINGQIRITRDGKWYSVLGCEL